MKQPFLIYVYCTLAGWFLRLIWDFNHSYKWIPSGDFFYGVGVALIFMGWAIYIDSTKRNGWEKVFTRVALFTALANLCDEAIFDPLKTSWQEWATALLISIIYYHYQKYNDKLARNN